MPIYTKKGDRGETALPGRKGLSKSDQIFEFLGSIDHLNAFIGLLLNEQDQQLTLETRSFLVKIQSALLTIGSATVSEEQTFNNSLNELKDLTTSIEEQIDRWDQNLPELKNFILPGGSRVSSLAHVIRTVVRQTERNYCRLKPSQQNETVLTFVNRLSDYFFQLARWNNFKNNHQDLIWKIQN